MPPLGRLGHGGGHHDDDYVDLYTYEARWLALHALSRLVNADEALRSIPHSTGGQSSDQQTQALRTSQALAMLELSFLYDLHRSVFFHVGEDKFRGEW